MKNYKELGNKYLKHRKKRAVLVTLSMVLATLLLYIVCTLIFNFWFDMKAIAEEQENYHATIENVTLEQREKIEEYVTVRSVDFAYVETEYIFAERYGGEDTVIYFFDNFDQTTFNFKLIEGEYPTTSDELLVRKDNLHRFSTDVQVGTKLTVSCYKKNGEYIGNKEYTVAGIIDYELENDLEYMTNEYFSLGTPDMNMTAYVRFDKRADWDKYVYNLAKDVGVDVNKPNIYSVNDWLATFYFNPCSDSMAYIAIFLMILVFVTYIAMVMVRGLFTANLMDNVREFNILKAMGATDKKIKDIFKREIYLEGLMAFGVGVVVSHIILFIFKNVLKLQGMNFDFNALGLVVGFLFLYLTISLAIIEPLSILKKVPIVEGIKANYAINNMKEKKRGGKLFRIFGVEGEYAYKNLRRNRKNFTNGVATFAVSVLLITVLITAFSNINNMLVEEAGIGDINDTYDFWTECIPGKLDEQGIAQAEMALESKEYIAGVDGYYSCTTRTYSGGNILEYTDEALAAMKDIRYSDEQINQTFVTVHLYTDEQLEKLNAYMKDGVDATTIKNGGVIICNSFGYYDLETEQNVDVDKYKVSVGDEIEILNLSTFDEMLEAEGNYKSILECDDRTCFEKYTIMGICTGGVGLYTEDVIMSASYVKETYGLNLSTHFNGFLIDCDEDEFTITDMASLEVAIYEEAEQSNYDYMNMAKWMDSQTRSFKIIVICIVGFLMLMGIISILNNMINEHQVRKREVSILRAIGMNKKKLNKMLMLEKIIMGLLAWIIGTVLGMVLSKLILVSLLYQVETGMIYPVAGYVLVGVGVIGIMVLISMINVVSMGKMDITDGIRNEE